MLMSDIIADIIEEMIREGNGKLELKRNDLAGRIGCVPSQINYVITSRFTPERGYMIESRRGGGGYVRITKVQMTRDQYLMHLLQSIGGELDGRSAQVFTTSMLEKDVITSREADIIRGIFNIPMENELRADMMRQIILALLK